jgi:hypothetical protein
VHVSGTLKLVGDVVVATASQGSYTGPFTYASTNAAVLELSLQAPQSRTHRVRETRRASGKQTLVSPTGKIYIVATGSGTASVSVTGNGQQTVSPASLSDVAVPSTGSVVLSPPSLAFSATGSASAKNVRIAQGAYAGSFSETDDCTNVATLSPKANGDGEAAFTVTPVAAGSCKAAFKGGDGKTASLPISVVLPGSVVIDPPSAAFTQTGSSKSVKVTQANYSGTFGEADDCSSIASLKAQTNAGGSAVFTVTATGAGSCEATFTGGNGKSASLPISVVLPGGVVLKPSSMSFTGTGSSNAQSVAVSQAGYTGTFVQSDDCSSIATVTAASNAGGSATFVVTPVGPGSCKAKFTGENAKSASLRISVTLPAPIVSAVCAKTVDACSNGTAAKPGSVQLTAIGNTATLTPSDPSWKNFPHFTLTSDTCNTTDDPSAGGNWATFSPAAGGSAATFAVTAKNAGTPGNAAQCTAAFTDASGRTVRVNVEITLGSIGIH